MGKFEEFGLENDIHSWLMKYIKNYEYKNSRSFFDMSLT